jgi:chitinase
MLQKKKPSNRPQAGQTIESLEQRVLLAANVSGVIPPPLAKSSGLPALSQPASTSPLKAQVVGYFPDYEFSQWDNIDLGALTWINYFSLIANADGSLQTSSSGGYSFSQLQSVVSAAHGAASRVGVSITIDGATPFLAIAQNATATNNFVNNLLLFCSTYHLDGIDFDYEPDSLTSAQENSFGSLLAAVHAQTSAHGLLFSAAVQPDQQIIPQAYLSDLDRYNVMCYDLEYNSSAPYNESIAYLNDWANYGVPKSELIMGVPFYGRAGTNWNNSQDEAYGQILSDYAAANRGAYPAADLDSLTVNGTTWGFNGITTIQNKAQYVLENGYGGMMIWELGWTIFPTANTTNTPCSPRSKTNSNSPTSAAPSSTIATATASWNAAITVVAESP